MSLGIVLGVLFSGLGCGLLALLQGLLIRDFNRFHGFSCARVCLRALYILQLCCYTCKPLQEQGKKDRNKLLNKINENIVNVPVFHI